MKIIRKLIIAVVIICTIFSFNVYGDYTVNEKMEQTIKLLGIMVGDESGNLNLDKNVTRAEFTKMIVKASSFKDLLTENINVSVFKDVSNKHWSASYIQTSVNQKWITGYVDGTFKPDNSIKYEEAITVILRVLGYNDANFNGSYPIAQKNMFNNLGLNKNLNLYDGKELTRKDCMFIFTNLMNATMKNGEKYAKSLGYNLSNDGEIDYNALLLSKMSNPIVVYNNLWIDTVPFSVKTANIYRNGIKSEMSDISMYDVVYYCHELKSIWAYDNKILGTYSNATPNIATPKEVTVAGNRYEIGTNGAMYKLTNNKDIKIGDTILLALGMDGKIVDVIQNKIIYSPKCGVVVNSEKVVDKNGNTLNKISVACTDGTIQKYDLKQTYNIGSVVAIKYENGKINVSRVSKTEGVLNYKLSDNIEIMDVNSYGEYKLIQKNRIINSPLRDTDSLYYSLDSNKQIDKLILNDKTGDLYDYGIMTSVNEVDKKTEEGFILNGSYTYIVDGKSATYNTDNSILKISIGPVIIKNKNNSIDNIKNLQEINITSINSVYTFNKETKYLLSDSIHVYLYKNGTYYKTELLNVMNLEKFNLKGYYNGGNKYDKLIRIIIATDK